MLEAHFGHAGGSLDQQRGAICTDVPIANRGCDIEFLRNFPPEVGANLLICLSDKRHQQRGSKPPEELQSV